MSSTNRLLIVDSDNEIAKHLATAARSCGYSASVATTYDDFHAKVKTIKPTVILIDLSPHGKGSIQYLKTLGQESCSASIIIVGATDKRSQQTVAHLGQFLALNMAESLAKPFSINAFRRILIKLAGNRESVAAQEIESAIKEGRIKTHYQPRAVSHRSGQWNITSLDALAYWHQGDSIGILPSEFSGCVDEIELKASLTDILAGQIATQLGTWSRQGYDFNASFNLPSAMLFDRKLPDRLSKITRTAGIENSRLTLEVAENLILDHSAETMEILSRLHTEGFRLAIDKFGTGYSSLEQLHSMPYRNLNIDLSCVSASELRQDAGAIVEAAVLLGHRLGLAICAKGVENEKTFEYVKNIGCDTQQGNFIGRRVPAAKLIECVSAWHAGVGRTTPIVDKNDHPCPH